MELFGIEDQGLENPVGFRPHCNTTSTHKQSLWPYCTLKINPVTQKETYELPTFLDILHRNFRETLFPRIGNLDMVHSYLVDMLLFCQHEKEENTGDSLDISHVMWSELVSAISERKCPIYGPFIMLLIEKSWERVYPKVLLETGDLVSHEIKSLRKKENWGTAAPCSSVPPGAADMETEADADDDDDYEPSGAEPSWAKKLKRKMKKLFCMESHGQYMTHVAEKKARGVTRSSCVSWVRPLPAVLRARSLRRRSGFSSTVRGPIPTPSSSRLKMAVQMTLPGCDERAPQFAFIWSHSNALFPFGVSMPKGERV